MSGDDPASLADHDRPEKPGAAKCADDPASPPPKAMPLLRLGYGGPTHNKNYPVKTTGNQVFQSDPVHPVGQEDCKPIDPSVTPSGRCHASSTLRVGRPLPVEQ